VDAPETERIAVAALPAPVVEIRIWTFSGGIPPGTLDIKLFFHIKTLSANGNSINVNYKRLARSKTE
jgi:hypothetical protein